MNRTMSSTKDPNQRSHWSHLPLLKGCQIWSRSNNLKAEFAPCSASDSSSCPDRRAVCKKPGDRSNVNITHEKHRWRSHVGEITKSNLTTAIDSHHTFYRLMERRMIKLRCKQGGTMNCFSNELHEQWPASASMRCSDKIVMVSSDAEVFCWVNTRSTNLNQSCGSKAKMKVL